MNRSDSCTRSLARLYTRGRRAGERQSEREGERGGWARNHESKISRLPSGFFPGVSAVKLSYPQGERHTHKPDNPNFSAPSTSIYPREGQRKQQRVTTGETAREGTREKTNETRSRRERGKKCTAGKAREMRCAKVPGVYLTPERLKAVLSSRLPARKAPARWRMSHARRGGASALHCWQGLKKVVGTKRLMLEDQAVSIYLANIINIAKFLSAFFSS